MATDKTRVVFFLQSVRITTITIIAKRARRTGRHTRGVRQKAVFGQISGHVSPSVTVATRGEYRAHFYPFRNTVTGQHSAGFFSLVFFRCTRESRVPTARVVYGHGFVRSHVANKHTRVRVRARKRSRYVRRCRRYSAFAKITRARPCRIRASAPRNGGPPRRDRTGIVYLRTRIGMIVRTEVHRRCRCIARRRRCRTRCFTLPFRLYALFFSLFFFLSRPTDQR